MKRYILLFVLFLSFSGLLSAQSNTGSPYSMNGIGLLPDNFGPYTSLGGVSAAMRDDNNINFLNPASYTAFDSNRFYIQLGMVGEYVHIATHQEKSKYRVAQNAALNMGLRLARNLYTSFGFNQRSDIGYDLYYHKEIAGDNGVYYTQQISGKGGLNDVYLGLAYKWKEFSIGVNTSYTFGNLERRLTLIPLLTNAYTINTQEKIDATGAIFTFGLQYRLHLSPTSKLTLGSAFNLSSALNATKNYTAYKVNSSSNETLEDEEVDRGTIRYPERIIGGFSYDYKDKWTVSGDYTFQAMSKYREFGSLQDFKDYHKVSLGISLLPAHNGRRWWQRNRYNVGGYAVRSQIYLNNTYINTFALTLGSQIPVFIQNRELLLGVAFDGGVRGTRKNGLIQETFARVRLNIAFKEGWFMKRKIN